MVSILSNYNSIFKMNKISKYIVISLLISALSIAMIYILTDIIGLWYMLSAVIVAGILAIISFLTNYLWTWKVKNKETKTVITSRFIRYAITGGCTTLVTWSLLYTLTEFANLWYIVSAIICWLIALAISFLVNNFWTYKENT